MYAIVVHGPQMSCLFLHVVGDRVVFRVVNAVIGS